MGLWGELLRQRGTYVCPLSFSYKCRKLRHKNCEVRMLRYRLFRNGDHVITGETTATCGSELRLDTKPGDIVYLLDWFWESQGNHWKVLGAGDEKVQGLYHKALVAERLAMGK